MADLSGLIRVRKYAVEQKQKFLSELYRQAEEQEAQKQTLIDQRAEEQRKVQEMGVEMLSYFGPYSDAVKQRIKDIDISLITLNKRIEMAREDVRTAFAELKKVELTQEARDKEEAIAIKKKEDDQLDEIALDTYRKKQEEAQRVGD